jgi:DNA repair exonuclease SbcCD ATPase subunit
MGRHCFLFGANARGKSSIVEAIRWCLFGLERDSDVRNRFSEAVDCRVELRLRDAAGLWRLERRLRPGQLRSDLTIRNPDGKEVIQRQALPNLVRLGTSAGAVVFFSAQQATRARAYGDLTRFHEVLYEHLSLSEAERLRTALKHELEEQLEIERQRAEALQSAEDKLREQLKEVGTRIEEILRSPPWGLDELPTRVMSEKRIRSFVADLADEAGKSVDAEWECSEALDHVERWVHELSRSHRAKREQVIASNKAQDRQLSARIDSIRASRQCAAANKTAAADLDRQLAKLCAGARLDELEAHLEVALSRLSKEAQFARARKAVAPLLGPDVHACPIYGLTCNGANLLTRLTEVLDAGNAAHEQTAQEVQVLEQRKEQAQRLTTQRDTASQAAESARWECEQLVAQMAEELGCPSDAWEGSAEARLTELRGRLNNLQQEGTSATEHSARHLQRMKALREEWRYHQLRDEEQRLRREIQEGLETARGRLRALEDFRFVVDNLYKVLCEEFDAAVDRALPLVSDQLTEAFQRLTNHPAFDVLRVERALGPDELVVRVGSTRARVPWSRPEDGLNGGAYAALGLIPHFVFSGFHAEQAELNVLIVDDPSQSFDTTHVELLLEELHRASH